MHKTADAEPQHVDDAIANRKSCLAASDCRRPNSNGWRVLVSAAARFGPGVIRRAAGTRDADSGRAGVSVRGRIHWRMFQGAGEIVPAVRWELASRLSYFLWSSLPDEELPSRGRWEAGRSGHRRGRRGGCCAIPRLGDWPPSSSASGWVSIGSTNTAASMPDGFRSSTSRCKRPCTTKRLSFFEYIVREDRPVPEILFADYTFLNASLARHYGIDTPEIPEEPCVACGGRRGAASRRLAGNGCGVGGDLGSSAHQCRQARRLGAAPSARHAGSATARRCGLDCGGRRSGRWFDRPQAARSPSPRPTCNNCHSRIDPAGLCPGTLRSDWSLARAVSRRTNRSTLAGR